MTTALVVAVFLFLISAAVMNYAAQALRTEAWMTERAQRSLHPLAWSTAHLVLDMLSGDIDPVTRKVDPNDENAAYVEDDGGSVRLFSGIISFLVTLDDSSSVDVKIVLSSDKDNNYAQVTSDSPINVTVTATDGKNHGLKSIVAGKIVSVDTGTNPKGINIDWK